MLYYRKRCINTKASSPNPKCLAYKTRLLCNQGILLKNKGRSVYILNWILSSSKKFPLENNSRASVK